MSILSEETQPQYNIAIIGAGPRGTSVIERLAKLAIKVPELATMVRVTVFDPYRPGSGHVWSPKQSPHFLMNTPASFPTVAPERVVTEPGLSFQQFVDNHGDGHPLDEREAATLRNTRRGTYPPRAIYGCYLEHVYDSCVQVLDAHPNIVVNYVPAEVIAVRPQGIGYQLEYEVSGPANHGTEQVTVDTVVLALGHQSSELNPWQKQLQRAAEQAEAIYLPPAVPADVDYSNFHAGEPALLRGMGLNFFDAMAELTLGRGGIFKEVSDQPGQRFEYIASGQEPQLIAASRRGTPYWGKPVVDEFIPAEISLRFFHAEDLIIKVVEARRSNPESALSFARHIWPQLHRDILWAYYSQCASIEAANPIEDPTAFLVGVEDILEAEHHEGNQVWLSELRTYIEQFPHLSWLDIPSLARPFDQIGFGSHEEYQHTVREYLAGNARHSTGGLSDPLSRAIMTMNAGRMVIKDLVTKGILDEQSRIEEVQAHFEPLVEGLSSGPPLERIEQLLALSRASLVHFIGPEPEFGFNDLSGKFTASSPWVDTDVYEAKVLCEAMMPANRVLQNNTALITQLLAEKVARAHTWRNAEGERMTGSGFDVVGEPYRLINGEGLAHRGVFVLGLQLSSAQWGTAIAAQAGDTTDPAAQTLRDAEQIVIEIARMAGVNLEELLAGSAK